MNFGIRKSRQERRFYLVALPSWPRYLTTLNPGFLISKNKENNQIGSLGGGTLRGICLFLSIYLLNHSVLKIWVSFNANHEKGYGGLYLGCCWYIACYQKMKLQSMIVSSKILWFFFSLYFNPTFLRQYPDFSPSSMTAFVEEEKHFPYPLLSCILGLWIKLTTDRLKGEMVYNFNACF